jgi:hypothetical protein
MRDQRAEPLPALDPYEQYRHREVSESYVPAEPEPAKGPRYTAPAPPPPELNFDLAKWNRMSRAERRAVLRYAKRMGK